MSQLSSVVATPPPPGRRWTRAVPSPPSSQVGLGPLCAPITPCTGGPLVYNGTARYTLAGEMLMLCRSHLSQAPS